MTEWPLQKVVIHHTVEPAPVGDPADAVREIRRLHTEEYGWDDIGYGWLIGPDGSVHRGREGTGAHVLGHNEGTLGIALLGDFSHAAPPPAAVDALVDLVAAVTSTAGIDPSGEGEYVNPLSGLPARVANVAGHRDLRRNRVPGIGAVRGSARGEAPRGFKVTPSCGASVRSGDT